MPDVLGHDHVCSGRERRRDYLAVTDIDLIRDRAQPLQQGLRTSATLSAREVKRSHRAARYAAPNERPHQ